MKTIIIDNYDSFTFNLYHFVVQIDPDVVVVRNDQFLLSDLDPFSRIIISPGPGLPQEAGKIIEVIQKFYKTKKILGICLGHQAIVEAFGGELENLSEVLHGRAVETYLSSNASYIFDGIPEKIETGRYHSFVAKEMSLPNDLHIIAMDIYGKIQGVKHRNYDVIGLQFHPESVLTEYGFLMIKNWLENGI